MSDKPSYVHNLDDGSYKCSCGSPDSATMRFIGSRYIGCNVCMKGPISEALSDREHQSMERDAIASDRDRWRRRAEEAEKALEVWQVERGPLDEKVRGLEGEITRLERLLELHVQGLEVWGERAKKAELERDRGAMNIMSLQVASAGQHERISALERLVQVAAQEVKASRQAAPPQKWADAFTEGLELAARYCAIYAETPGFDGETKLADLRSHLDGLVASRRGGP